MCSPVSKFTKQLKKDGFLNLFKFKSKDEPSRDFIFIDDVINIMQFLKNKNKLGLYNIGTGEPQTFINVAEILLKNLGYGEINFIKFPEYLRNKYQYYTKANISKLKKLGYSNKIKNLENGIKKYLNI